MKNQNSISDKASKFSAANYLERMKEKDEEEKANYLRLKSKYEGS